MKKGLIYVLTAVMAAIMTVCMLDVTSEAEEATVRPTTMAELVYALKNECGDVIYENGGIYVHYTLQDPMTSEEFYTQMAKAQEEYKAYYDEYVEWLEHCGLTIEDLHDEVTKPYYEVIRIIDRDALVMA